MAKSEQTDDNLLFTEQTVAGYTVKKLSFGELNKITPQLIKLFENVTPVLDTVTGQTPTPAEVAGVYLQILPHAVPVIAVLCDATEEELNKLPASDVIKLMKTLWDLNQEVVQDFFAIIGTQDHGLGL